MGEVRKDVLVLAGLGACDMGGGAEVWGDGCGWERKTLKAFLRVSA